MTAPATRTATAIAGEPRPTGTAVRPPATDALGRSSLAGLLGRLANTARREIVTFHPLGQLGPGDALPPVTHGQLRRGVRASTVCTPTALEERTVRTSMEELAAAGARVRVTTTLPHWLVLVDRRVAVVSLEPESGPGDAVVVRDPPIVAGLRALFSTTWREARPLAEGVDRSADDVRERDRAVLHVMSSGVTDDGAAQVMGVSTRTYRRYVAELLQRLGARSRFQAGINAVERGLL